MFNHDRRMNDMCPLKDFYCDECSTETKDFLYKVYEDLECPKCGNKEDLQLQFSYAANYTIGGDNSSSERPNKSRSTENKK